MKPIMYIMLVACVGAAACSDTGEIVGPTGVQSGARFFVSSATSTTANLGGLRGADSRCQSLAAAVGLGAKTWKAYLSAEQDPDNGNRPTHARDRIGQGPWTNVNGTVIANTVAELHARTGDASVFIDERGQRIPGQWPGSPSPVQHDILTGSNQDGTLMPGLTCADWTSESTSLRAQVGHSDGLGPGGSTAGALTSWNASHASQSCANTAPLGGAGRIYCFAIN